MKNFEYINDTIRFKKNLKGNFSVEQIEITTEIFFDYTDNVNQFVEVKKLLVKKRAIDESLDNAILKLDTDFVELPLGNFQEIIEKKLV